MNDLTPQNAYDPAPDDFEYKEAQKRVKKIKAFYKDLSSWAGVSVILIAMNFFMSGGIGWAKYPVFFWGIFIVSQAFNIIRLQRLDKAWEERQLRRFTGRPNRLPQTNQMSPQEDYSEELLDQQEREMADLSEYRKVNKPWKDKDLV